MTAYLERLAGTLARSSVQGAASELAHFGRFLARHDPGLASLALLDRQQHIEPYLNEVAAAVNHRTGEPIAASTARQRIQTVGSFLDAIAEWGWPEAPARRLIFPRDAPKLPHPLPRYLPPDQERALLAALEDSPNRLRADALLLLRATGMRIGELTMLELDCVHEVPGSGAWLKVPLGKLLTERMVPIDEETVEIIDRITGHRSPGRPLRHPRTGKMADFLLTHQGRRVSAETIRGELHRAAAEAGLDGVVPHMLRHTYATALVNAGCSLQALMALLGHVSAAMSLRYGRLFDATVRDEYQRALTLAKAQLGPVLPGRAHPAPGRRHHRRELARRAADQSPPGRRVLPARRRPGTVRLRQHLRALPELPQRRQLPARPATAARRHRSPRRRRRSPRLGRGSRPPPPPPRPARPAHRPGQCQLTTTTPPSRGRLRRARRDRAAHHVHRSRSTRADQPHHSLPAGRPARRHRRAQDPRPGRQHLDRPDRPDRPDAPQPRSRRRQGPPPRGNHPPPRARTPHRAVAASPSATGYPQDELRLAG